MPRTTITTTRPFKITPEIQEHAERELADYFAGRSNRCRRNGWRERVEAVLATVSGYHLGVLRLYHAPRVWPEAITKAFGSSASLAIRLDCCDHPAQGSTAALEAAAAERLVAVIAQEGPTGPTVIDLYGRADDHFDAAVRAYAKARAKHAGACAAADDDMAEAAE